MPTPSDLGLAIWFANCFLKKEHMSDAGDLKALEDQLDAGKRVVEALQAQYNEALQELRVALQREAELKALWAELDAHAHYFE